MTILHCVAESSLSNLVYCLSSIMDIASSSQASRRQGPSVVATAVDHARLTKTNLTAIRSFRRDYNQYAREVSQRALQLTGGDLISTDVSKPAQLKFCENSEWLDSVIDFRFHWQGDWLRRSYRWSTWCLFERQSQILKRCLYHRHAR